MTSGVQSVMDKLTFPTKDDSLLGDVHVYVLIVLVASIIYGKSIVYQYTYFDDVPLVVLNQSILSNFANIPRLLTTDVFISTNNAEIFYRPFLNFLFMLELQLAKNSPVIFHITNILLHIGCCLLMFVVFKQLRVSKMIAAAAALLFCALPLNTSAVVWIPGTNDTLLTLIVLGSFSLFLHALDTRRLLPFILHFALFFLAMLTKESAILLPFLFVSYALFVRREKLSRKQWLFVVAGYLVPLVVWFIMRSTVTHIGEVRPSLVSLALSWVNNSPAFILYIGKIFLPFNLSVMPNLKDQSLSLGTISVLALVAAFFLRRPSSFREIGWGVGWFFVFLAPTFLSATIFHEHRTYCPLIGLLFAIAQLPVVQSIDFSKSSRMLGFVAILTFYGALAMFHSEHFRNRTAYAMDAYLQDPSVDASQAAMADLFLSEGNYDQAERVLKAAIARDSSMRFVHRLLGDVYAHRHEYALAAREYKTSIQIDQFEAYAYIGYGKVCIEEGHPDEALHLWKRTVALNPNLLVGYQYLATFYTYVRNKPDSAMFYVKQVQQRGGNVVPALLEAIQTNSKSGERTK
jgi:hypothetical protein